MAEFSSLMAMPISIAPVHAWWKAWKCWPRRLFPAHLVSAIRASKTIEHSISVSSALHQCSKSLAQQRRRFRSQTVDFAVGRLHVAVSERRFLIPLPFRDDVADLVVGQADDHAMRTVQLPIDGRLDGGIGEVGPFRSGVGNLVEHQFRIDFARNASDVEVAEPQPGDFRL